ncbi:hypothetical protein GA0115242_14653 [Streptomyces sp. SolWspMP-5a-2]|nr:hypothetical protein GA0115242_14653 [Streptomyces sp. SolWspMP-5a-2]
MAPRGRPGGGPVGGREVFGGGRAEDGRGVVRPGWPGAAGARGIVVGGPGVHGGGGPAGAVGVGGDDHLEVRGVARRGQQQRCVEGEFVDVRGAVVPARLRGEFEQGRAGQQRDGVDGVVVEPAVGVLGEASGEDEALVVGGAHDGTEQRVPGRDESGGRHVGGAGAGVGAEPVACALEGVGGQGDLAGAGAGVGLRPVDGDAVDEHLAQRGEQAPGAAVAEEQRSDDDRVATGFLQGVRDAAGQDRVGAALHERVEAAGRQLAHGFLEADPVAQVAYPVGGVRHVVAEPVAGDRGEEGHLGAARADGGEVGEDAVGHGVDLCGVGGVVDGDASRPHPLRLAPLHQIVQSVDITGDHRRTGPVDRRDRHPPPVHTQQPLHLRHRTLHRHHPAVTGKLRRDRLAPQRDHPRPVLQTQRTRHHRRRDLPLRMTHHRGRTHPERLPHRRQRHHHRPQHRLHDVHPLQRLRIPQRLQQRNPQIRLQRSRTLPHPLREHRHLGQQLHAHTGPLRPLTGEDEHRPRPAALHRHGTGGTGTTRQRPHAVQEFLARGARDHRTTTERRTTRGQGEAHVRCGRVLPLLDERRQPLGLRPESGLVVAGEHPRHHGGQVAVARGSGRRGGLLDDHVGVGAADPEGGDARPPGAAGVRPVPRVRQQTHRTRGPVDVRRRILRVQGRGQRPVPQRLDHLDQAADPGRGLGVPDVGLHRPEPQGPPRVPVLPVRRQQRPGLDRVAQAGPGAVRLDGVDVRGAEPRVGQRRPDHPLLGQAARGRQTVGRAVLVDGAAAHDREHPVAVAPGVRQPLQHQDTHALGPSRAVGGGRERLAPAVRRQSALAAELTEHAGRRHDGDAARQRQVALARPQRPTGQVHRDQRRRTRRVDRHRRALEAERVGHPAGDHARGAARQEVAGEVVRGVVRAGAVVVRGGTDVDTGGRTPQPRRIESGLLQRLPGGLQEQPLLRVHRQRLARRDAEEVRVEVRGSLQESAAGGGRVLVLRVLVRGCPVPVGGPGGGGVGAVGDQAPQVVRGGDAAGVPAGHADDGEGFVRGGARAGAVVPGVGRSAGEVRGGLRRCPAAGLRRRGERWPRAHGEARGGPAVRGGRRAGGMARVHQRVEVGGERRGRRMVEHRAHPERQSRAGGEPPGEFLDHDRVEAEVLEGERRVDRTAVPCDGGGLLAHQGTEGGGPLRAGERGQPGDVLVPAVRRPGDRTGTAARGFHGSLGGLCGLGGLGALNGLGGVGEVVEPEAAALEGVGGQVHAAVAAQQRSPVDVRARDPQFRQRPDRAVSGVLPLADQRHGGGAGPRVPIRVVRRLLDGRGEEGLLTDLQEGRHAVVAHRADGVGEPDALAGLALPVRRVPEELRRRRLPRHGRRERQPRDAELDRGQDRAVRRRAGPGQGQVRSVRVLQRSRAHTGAGQPPGLGGDGVAGPGDQHRAGRVERGDHDAVVRAHGVRRGVHRDRRAVRVRGLHQPAAREHHPCGVAQRPQARGVGGRRFPDRVSRHHRRCDTP